MDDEDFEQCMSALQEQLAGRVATTTPQPSVSREEASFQHELSKALKWGRFKEEEKGDRETASSKVDKYSMSQGEGELASHVDVALKLFKDTATTKDFRCTGPVGLRIARC